MAPGKNPVILSEAKDPAATCAPRAPDLAFKENLGPFPNSSNPRAITGSHGQCRPDRGPV